MLLMAGLLLSGCWNMLNPLDPASAGHTGTISMRILSLELTPTEIDGLDHGPIDADGRARQSPWSIGAYHRP